MQLSSLPGYINDVCSDHFFTKLMILVKFCREDKLSDLSGMVKSQIHLRLELRFLS